MIYRQARALFDAAETSGPFRLIGVGIAELVPESQSDLSADLLDPGAALRAGAERATDVIRERFDHEAIVKGRSFR